MADASARSNEGTSAAASDDLGLLCSAVRDAGRLAVGFFKGPVRQWTKGDASPVSEADVAVDLALKDALLSARPRHGWLSEETDPVASRDGRLFVVDPIDGTRAFLSGQPAWALSVALVEGGRPIASVLYRPMRDEMLTAVAGLGSHRNGASLKVTDRPLSGASIAARSAVFQSRHLERYGVQKAPYIPSLALRLGYIATGRHDGVLTKPGAHHWDVAAADLILSEAGGVLLSATDKPLRYDDPVTRHGVLAAGAPSLSAELLRAIDDVA